MLHAKNTTFLKCGHAVKLGASEIAVCPQEGINHVLNWVVVNYKAVNENHSSVNSTPFSCHSVCFALRRCLERSAVVVQFVAGEPFGGQVPKLSINFEEILLPTLGNLQSKIRSRNLP